MTEYTASNGITVYVRDGGTVQFQHGTREESCGIIQIFPHSEWWQTLREFFQHERDTELGRWRWPENRDYVVYPPIHDRDEYAVIAESTGNQAKIHPDRVRDAHRRGGVISDWTAAVLAYFDAHPEPKPEWYNATDGEVWVITVDGIGEFAATIETDPGFPRFISIVDEMGYGPRSGITDGRRIWPEVQS